MGHVAYMGEEKMLAGFHLENLKGNTTLETSA